MKDRITLFLEEVCAHIRAGKMHEEIKKELRSHIEESYDTYKSRGMEEEEAIEQAISDMGESSEVGERLNKVHRPQTDWLLILALLFILPIGVFLMYRCSLMDSSVSFFGFLLDVFLGIGVATILYFTDYTKWEKFSLPLYGLMFFTLFATHLFGRNLCVGRTWVVGPLTITSEYLFLFLAVSLSGILCREKGKGTGGMLRFLLFGMIPALFIPKFSTTFLWMLTILVLLFVCIHKGFFQGNRTLQTILYSSGIFLGILGGGLYLFANPYRLERLMILFTRGESDPSGGGWQMRMADYWLSSSQWFGSAPNTYAEDTMMRTLPSATTDYALVSTVATLGWGVGILFILLSAFLLWRMIRVTRRVKNDYGYFLSLSSCTVLGGWMTMGILMNFNLFPIYSSVPFLSYGSVAYVVSMALLGIVLSVWRQNRMLPKEKEMPSYCSRISFQDGKLVIDLKK